MPQSPQQLQEKFRSEEAKNLHTLVMRYLLGENELSEIKAFLEQHTDEKAVIKRPYLTERSANGFSHLDDIIHIGADKGIKTAKISGVFDLIVSFLEKTQKETLVKNITNDGFTLLQHAASSGDAELFEKALGFVNTHAKDGKQTVAENITNDGFTLLQTAAKSGNAAIFEKAVGFVSTHATGKGKQTVAENITNDGFTLLQTAASSGDAAIFEKAVGFVNAHAKDGKQKVAENITRDGFTLLQHAASSGNAAIFEKAVGFVSRHATVGGKQTVAENITNDGFTLPQQAASSGDAEIFEKALGFVNAHAKDGKKKIAENITRDGFTLLQHAVSSGDAEIFEKTLEFVDRHATVRGKQKVAENITRDGFTLLQHAASSGDAELFEKAVGFVNTHAKDGKQKIAKNITRDGFTLLQDAAKSGNAEIFAQALGFVQKAVGPKETFKLLAKANKKGFNPLHASNGTGDVATVGAVVDAVKKLYTNTADFESLRAIFETKANGFLSSTKAKPGKNNREIQTILDEAMGWYKQMQQNPLPSRVSEAAEPPAEEKERAGGSRASIRRRKHREDNDGAGPADAVVAAPSVVPEAPEGGRQPRKSRFEIEQARAARKAAQLISKQPKVTDGAPVGREESAVKPEKEETGPVLGRWAAYVEKQVDECVGWVRGSGK